MSENVSRRGFLKGTVAATTAAALAMSFEEQNLLAQAAESSKPAAGDSPGEMPMGKIGDLSISRLVCGGNLISGFAHSRDLIYVSPLLRQYFTDDKVCETLELCESRGINTCIMRVDSQIFGIVKKYREEFAGKIQWIAQVKPTKEDPGGDIVKACDLGAVGVYVHGGVGDDAAKAGDLGFIAKAMEIGRKRGVLVGLGGHEIATIKAYEAAKFEPDFYMKTLNSKNYWSANAATENDNVWEKTPQETIDFMKTVKRPWIAFKVMGAGAIHPKEAFSYAYENGADFICAGMFDFQVVEDVMIAQNALAKLAKRERAWLA